MKRLASGNRRCRLRKPSAAVSPEEHRAAERRADDAAFAEAKRLDTPSGYQAYLDRGGRHTAEAEVLLAQAAESVELALRLAPAERELVQHGLASLGYAVGVPDGGLGERTRTAIAGYQRGQGLAATGYLTAELRDALVALGEARQADFEPATKVYWTTIEGHTIQRANLDGSDVEDVVTGLGYLLEAVAVDSTEGKLYWTNNVWGYSGRSYVQRANFDGSNVETIVELRGQSDGIALDIAGRKIYWANEGPGSIHRANLDGTNAEVLVSSVADGQSDIDLRGMALDMGEGKIYWSNWELRKIQRANLDGSNVEDVVAGSASCGGIDLDRMRRKIYWADCVEEEIYRADVDGTNVERLVTVGSDGPQSVAVDSQAGKMYWTGHGSRTISRADLDGKNVEVVVGSQLVSGKPDGIALASGYEPE